MRNSGLLAVLCTGLILAPAAAGPAAADTQALDVLQDRLEELIGQEPEPLETPRSLALRLGDAEAVYEHVRDRIDYQDYPGLLKGSLGTLRSEGGNDLDQSRLLAEMIGHLGGRCRYARGQRKDESGQWVEHYWVQVQNGESWKDLAPTLPQLWEGEGMVKPGDTMTALPASQVHRVALKVICRVKESGQVRERTALEKEFEIAGLYGASLTLANRFDGRTENGRFVLEVVQPVLELDDEIFPGELIPPGAGEKPPSAASRLTGVFQTAEQSETSAPADRPPLEVLAQHVDVTLISPGRQDRFIYTVFDREEEHDADAAGLEGLIGAVAFEFSPAAMDQRLVHHQLLEDAASVQLLIESLSRVTAEDFSPAEPPEDLSPEDRAGINLALEAGNRAVARAVLMNYLRASDEALEDLDVPFEAAAFRSAPRAIMAAVSFQGDRLRYDLDLRRNPATYLLPDGVDPEWTRFLNYHRGLYESRLEGAVLISFTGQAGLTAGDVLTAAQQQEIPLRAIVRRNRRDLSSVELIPGARAKINRAVNRGTTVLLPERPVLLAGAERMAWFEFDPRTGYVDGVFPSGKHQAMTEYILEDVVMKGLVSQAMSYFVSTVAGYYFSIATGLGHFYACLLDLETPNTPCFGTGEVCGPAKADAVMFCTAFKNAQQGFELGMGWADTDITGMFPWPNAWEKLAGEPCARGASLGLKIWGCTN
jgi:hypothetical protein